MTAGAGGLEVARDVRFVRVRAATAADEPAGRELWTGSLASFGEALPGDVTGERAVGPVHRVPRVDRRSRSLDPHLDPGTVGSP